MSEHLKVQKALGPYVLGALDVEEERQVDGHLLRCVDCRTEERELRRVHEHLTDLADTIEKPPPDLQSRILGRLPRQRRPRAPLAAAAVLAVFALVAILYASGILGQQAVASTTLQPTGRAPEAGGRVSLYQSGDNIQVRLDAWGLPRCKKQEYYEVWFVEGKERVSGGSFTVGSEGRIETSFNAPGFAGNYHQVGITSEIAGDSRASDNRILVGNFSGS